MDLLLVEALKVEDNEGEMVRLMIDITSEATNDSTMQLQAIKVAAELVRRKLNRWQQVDKQLNSTRKDSKLNPPIDIPIVQDSLIGRFLYLAMKIQGRDNINMPLLTEILGVLFELIVFDVHARDAYSLWRAMQNADATLRERLLKMTRTTLEQQSDEFMASRLNAFIMSGEHAGIIAPSNVSLPPKKGYTFCVNLLLDPGTPSMALYSFRGESGHGIAAVIEEENIILYSYTSQGSFFKLCVPLKEKRAEMNHVWTHLAVSHAKKMVFKDKIHLYLNGEPFFVGHLPYPDPLQMAGGHNCIGTLPQVPSFQGQMSQPTLLGYSLSDAEVLLLMPPKSPITQWLHENGNLVDKSKFIFAYDSRICSPTSECVCYDASGNGNHGWLEPGTRPLCRTPFINALTSFGGVSVYLRLLFEPSHFRDAVQIIHVVAFGVRTSPRCLSQYTRQHGSRVVAYLLTLLPPSDLTVDLLDAIVELFDSISLHVKKTRLRTIVLSLFVLHGAWFRAPFVSQVRLLEYIIPKYLSIMDQPTSNQTKMEVEHWCEFMAKWYGSKRHSGSGLSDNEASICCKLLLDKIIDPLLFPKQGAEDNGAWVDFIGHVNNRMHDSLAAKDVDVQEIFRYITRTLYIPDTSGVTSPPSRKMLSKLQKHSPLAMWYTWLDTPSLDIRLQVLHAYEAMTQQIHLRFHDAVLFHNSLHRYPLEMRQCEVILDVSLGHRNTLTGDRSTSTPRGHFIPVVLLKLLASAEYRVQLYVLYELQKYLRGPNSSLFKEYVRVDPEWMKILVSIRAEALCGTSDTSQANASSDTLNTIQLNDYCMVLCDETSTVETRIQIIQSIGASHDECGADFMLTVLQHACAPSQVKQAIIDTIIASFPSHAKRLVDTFCTDIVTDILVYSLYNVNHGWIHLLETYFYLFREPIRFVSILSSVADSCLGKEFDSDKDLQWENQSQFCSLLALLYFIADRMNHPIDEATHIKLLQKANHLWAPVLRRLHLVAWNGPKKPADDDSLLHQLFATYPLTRRLALYTLYQTTRIALLTTENADVNSIRGILEALQVITIPSESPTKQSTMQPLFLLSVLVELHRLWELGILTEQKVTLMELIHSVALEALGRAGPGSELAHALMGITALEPTCSTTLCAPLMQVVSRYAVEPQEEVEGHVNRFVERWKHLVDSNAVFNSEMTIQDMNQRTTIISVHAKDCEEFNFLNDSHVTFDDLFDKTVAEVKKTALRFKAKMDSCIRLVLKEPDVEPNPASKLSFKLSTSENMLRMRLNLKTSQVTPQSVITEQSMASSWRSESGSLQELTDILGDAHVRAVLRTATSSNVDGDDKSFDELVEIYEENEIVQEPATVPSSGYQQLFSNLTTSAKETLNDATDSLQDAVSDKIQTVLTIKDHLSDEASTLLHGKQLKRKSSIDFTLRNNASDFVCQAELVRQMYILSGQLRVTETELIFIPVSVVDEHGQEVTANTTAQEQKLLKVRRMKLNDIVQMYGRRYLLKVTALEIFVASSRKNYFFHLGTTAINELYCAIWNRRPQRLQANPEMKRLRHPSHAFRSSNKTQLWVNHEISTFEYLMWLNTVSGRTYNDLTQYPVFPWILADYTSATLDLSSPSTFRDLTKPMGALDPNRLQFFKDRYDAFDDPDIPKFMYGSHYSHVGAVLYYLVRLEPFTSLARRVQGGRFDHADRLFHSIADTWSNCLTDTSDLKELTPEWFYSPAFLTNHSNIELGTRQNGVELHDVVLPPYATSPEDFIFKNLAALESDYVSQNIHHWIDLIFGEKQRGPASIEANNVFFYLTYEGMVDIDSITDPVLQASMRAQIAHFGQTPSQLLREPHVERNKLALDHVKPCMPFLLPHVHPVVLLEFANNNLLCFDSSGQISIHRFSSPFKATISSKPAMANTPNGIMSPQKQPGSCLVSLESGVLELLDRKCRRVVPDYIWLKESIWICVGTSIVTGGHADGSALVYAVADGGYLCSVTHHSERITSMFSHGNYVVFGSADGTLSIWTLAQSNSWTPLLDTLNIFRPASKRIVVESDFSPYQVCLGHVTPITCVSLREDLDLVVSGSQESCLVHTISTGELFHELRIPPSTSIHAVAINMAGIILVSSTTIQGASIHSFSLQGALLATVLCDGVVTKMLPLTRTSHIIIGGSSGSRLLEAHTLKEVQALTTIGVCSAALSIDEKYVILGLDVMPTQLLSVALTL